MSGIEDELLTCDRSRGWTEKMTEGVSCEDCEDPYCECEKCKELNATI